MFLHPTAIAATLKALPLLHIVLRNVTQECDGGRHATVEGAPKCRGSSPFVSIHTQHSMTHDYCDPVNLISVKHTVPPPPP